MSLKPRTKVCDNCTEEYVSVRSNDSYCLRCYMLNKYRKSPPVDGWISKDLEEDVKSRSE